MNCFSHFFYIAPTGVLRMCAKKCNHGQNNEQEKVSVRMIER